MSGRDRVEPVFEGYVSVVPPRIGPSPACPDDALLHRLADVPVADVSDAVGRLYTMGPAIRPLYTPMRRVVGVALTVKAHPGDNLAIHGALATVRPHDVLVVDWLGYAEGCGSGALSLAGPRERGLAGIVIDGSWRDVDELRAADFPVFGRGEAAFSPAKREPGEINVPVCCGGVIVEAGDVVVADPAGVAVVPRRHLEPVVAWLGSGAPGAGTRTPPVQGAGSPAARHEEVFEARGGLRG